MIPGSVITALAFYRQPQRFGQLRDPRAPLPPGINDLLAAQSHCLSDEQIAQTTAKLGCTPDECRAAVAFFIKQVLLEPPGDHYRKLGVPRDADQELIRHHYRYLIRLFHPDRDVDNEGWDDLYAPVINEAYSVLRRPESRAAYDATLDDADADWDLLQEPPRPAPLRSPASKGRASGPLQAWFALSPRARLAGGVALVGGAVLFLLVLLGGAHDRGAHLTVTGSAVDESLQPPPQTADAGFSEAERGSVMERDPVAAAETRVRDVEQALSIEEHVRRQVAAATVAVLGPPGNRSVERLPQTVSATGQALSSQGAEEAPEVGAAPEPTVLASADQPLYEAPPPGPRPDRVAAVAPEVVVPVSRIEPQLEASPAPVETAAVTDTVAPVEQQTAPSVVAPPAVVPAMPPIAPVELAALLTAFEQAYEAGDAVRFAALFTDDARTSDAVGRESIQALYARFFARPERREMSLGKVRWRREGDNRHRGTAVAEVATLTPAGEDTARGKIKLVFDVRQSADGPRIAALAHP